MLINWELAHLWDKVVAFIRLVRTMHWKRSLRTVHAVVLGSRQNVFVNAILGILAGLIWCRQLRLHPQPLAVATIPDQYANGYQT